MRNMQTESKQQILERRKELEQELVNMLKETKSNFTSDHVRDAIFHEEDNNDMMKVVAVFDGFGKLTTKFSVAFLRPRKFWNTKINIRNERNGYLS
ncbi:hypothetical protein COT23_02095 [Candidatus Kaiserbacteria bacterium CG08_land_8_20_14_0_20_50_21]|uniref:Uncharacterized protein n=1 Tax=Candidatus Kaiserbacteria bacterium CG08_land_8_20_14_0_20_50_21 TaxID=1974604 RepID=A0A2H0YXP8_9BACT|nr:MAG: hypothetical protein COT23_02095 [Candidatus Kaiserbacteria bacterium CG08_land_8_20_14_0_20_50_21]